MLDNKDTTINKNDRQSLQQLSHSTIINSMEGASRSPNEQLNESSEYPQCSPDQIRSCKGKCSKEKSDTQILDDSSEQHKGCMNFCLKLQVVATDTPKNPKKAMKRKHKRRKITPTEQN